LEDFPEFITKLPELDIKLEGVSGHILQGDEQQVVFVRFEQDTVVPEHSHRAQWELVVSGEVRLRLEGEEITYRQGQSYYIPEGVPHSGVVSAGYRSIIIFDQADRYSAKST